MGSDIGPSDTFCIVVVKVEDMNCLTEFSMMRLAIVSRTYEVLLVLAMKLNWVQNEFALV